MCLAFFSATHYTMDISAIRVLPVIQRYSAYCDLEFTRNREVNSMSCVKGKNGFWINLSGNSLILPNHQIPSTDRLVGMSRVVPATSDQGYAAGIWSSV